MLETCACSWATSSGDFDSVVVRTLPGMSSNNTVDFVVPHEHLHVAAHVHVTGAHKAASVGEADSRGQFKQAAKDKSQT